MRGCWPDSLGGLGSSSQAHQHWPELGVRAALAVCAPAGRFAGPARAWGGTAACVLGQYARCGPAAQTILSLPLSSRFHRRCFLHGPREAITNEDFRQISAMLAVARARMREGLIHEDGPVLATEVQVDFHRVIIA